MKNLLKKVKRDVLYRKDLKLMNNDIINIFDIFLDVFCSLVIFSTQCLRPD